MVYVPIATYTSGQVPTEAQFNQIRDNFNALRYGEQLVKLYISSDQSVANATTTFIDWDSVVGTQVGTGWSMANQRRLYNDSGNDAIMTVNFNVEWLTSAVGERSAGVRRASDSQSFNLPSNGANQGGGNQSGLVELFLADGDYIEAFVRHTNGSTIGVHGGSDDRTHIFMSLAGLL